MAGDALHFVDGYGCGLHAAFHSVVGHEESDASYRGGVGREDYFEKSFGPGHTVVAYEVAECVGEYRPANYDYSAVGACYRPTLFLKALPCAGVKHLCLRTDIDHAERLAHGLASHFISPAGAMWPRS